MNIDRIFRETQGKLKASLDKSLRRKGYKTKSRDGFLYAKGNIPVMLVAHLDTVHRQPVEDICISQCGNILMSPQGIGGDDRCGVYMILRILEKLNKKPFVLFTEDEEIGCVGAGKFRKNNIKPKINYIIEFDRQGKNDAVFYDCDNPEFTKFVESVGFEESYGSYSDISTIAPHLGVAAVNISSGYFNPHTTHEYVDIRVMDRNIKMALELIQKDTDKFEYLEAVKYTSQFYDKYRTWEYSGYGGEIKAYGADYYDGYKKQGRANALDIKVNGKPYLLEAPIEDGFEEFYYDGDMIYAQDLVRDGNFEIEERELNELMVDDFLIYKNGMLWLDLEDPTIFVASDGMVYRETDLDVGFLIPSYGVIVRDIYGEEFVTEEDDSFVWNVLVPAYKQIQEEEK